MLVAFAVTVDPAHSGVVYAGVRAEDQQDVFKSTNGGATWARSDSGLNDSVIVLVADPRSSATLLRAGATYNESRRRSMSRRAAGAR